jgi:Protein of unknown function (DUF2591)
MKTINVSEATGPVLNWLVAKADDEKDILYVQRQYGRLVIRTAGDHETCDSECPYAPSTDWAQGGPIIEREVIVLTHPKYDCWTATGQDPTDLDVPLYQEDGPTPLIAAMRCYVASKLGHKVEIPDELYERKTND